MDPNIEISPEQSKNGTQQKGIPRRSKYPNMMAEGPKNHYRYYLGPTCRLEGSKAGGPLKRLRARLKGFGGVDVRQV